MQSFIPVVITIVIAAVMVGAALGLAALCGPRPRTDKTKETPFECGRAPFEEPGRPFPVHFYVTAILFIVFDIEVVFLYPWIAARNAVGAYGLLAVLIFLFLLTFALLYEWLKGGMEWR
ncbi:NADH-quinone oxidoreductase subunit A [bacterium]|nr:NADH-quinone oxidoreductase subunit A [bacterium]